MPAKSSPARKPAPKKAAAPKAVAVKKPAAVKKAAPAKKPAVRRAAAKKVQVGDLFYCETCGLKVVVDECGEIAVTPNFVCCEEAMIYQPAKAKASRK